MRDYSQPRAHPHITYDGVHLSTGRTEGPQYTKYSLASVKVINERLKGTKPLHSIDQSRKSLLTEHVVDTINPQIPFLASGGLQTGLREQETRTVSQLCQRSEGIGRSRTLILRAATNPPSDRGLVGEVVEQGQEAVTTMVQ